MSEEELNYKLREATPEDAPAIVGMISAASDEGVFHHRMLSLEGFLDFAFRNPREGYRLFVCQVRDELVGYIDSRINMGVGHVLGLYVNPRNRGRGIGKALMEKTLLEFQKQQCHKARLEVFADNHVAIALYASLNFVQEGYLHRDEERRDIIIMSKFL